ncbi:MAG: hypothetical protein WCI18_02575 [Pseudomonadota bacterium]
MSNLPVIALIFADIALLVVILRLTRRQNAHEATISDLTEERFLLKDMHDRMRSEIQSAETRQKELFNRFSHLAAEAEQEVSKINVGMQSSVEDISRQISVRFDGPLKELAQRQGALDLQYKKIKSERESIERAVARAEDLTKFFGKKESYQGALDDIQDKKYEDARVLLSSGNTVDAVSKRLGMARSEVELVKKFIHSGI